MGLSGGAIAGIVIGAVAVAALVVLVGAPWLGRLAAAASGTAVGALRACLLACLCSASSRGALHCRRPCRAPLQPPLCRSFNLAAAALWSSSASRKQREAADGGKRPTSVPAAPSGKGDRFFNNLLPSFARRDPPPQQ